MFANSEVEIAAVVVAGFEIPRAFESKPRLGGGVEIGGSAHQPRNILGQHVKDFGRRISGGQAFGIRREGGQTLVPAIGKLAALHALTMVRHICVVLFIGATRDFPSLPQLSSALADSDSEVF